MPPLPDSFPWTSLIHVVDRRVFADSIVEQFVYSPLERSRDQAAQFGALASLDSFTRMITRHSSLVTRERKRSRLLSVNLEVESIMNGAEPPVASLVRSGVEVCFTNPGTSEMHFVAALDAPDVVTPYQDFVKAGHYGVHHLAFFADDIDETIERATGRGFDRTCAMRDKGGYRYYDCQSRTMPDVWIEFLESYPGLHKIFENGIAAAADWDGRDPISAFEYKDL
jgi:hypothetical protein